MTAATLPPGPRLPTVAQTLLIGYVWDRWLASCRRRYGDVFTVRAIPFGEIVYFADPAAIKEIFTAPASTMHAGESNEVLSHVLGERSVLVTDEDEHLRARRAMPPHFHGDAVRAYAELIERLAEDELDSWPLGEPLRLHDRMRALTFEVILRAVFGVDDAARMTAMRDVLPDLVDLSGPLMLMFAWPQLGRIGPWRRWEELKARADALVVDEIERRRRDPALEQRTDILSLLLRGGMQDTDDLRDQLVTLLLAGHETTATALAWSFERLMRTPAVHARAVEAARAGDDAHLDAVAQEALRVRPVIFDVVRKLARPATIGGDCPPARGAV